MRVGRPVLVAMLVLVTSSTSALYVPQAHELVAEEEGTQDAIIAGGVDGGEPRDDGGERRASAGDGARAMVVDDDEAANEAEPPAPLPRMLLYTALLGGDKAFRSPLLPAFLWSAAKTPDVDILLIGDGEMPESLGALPPNVKRASSITLDDVVARLSAHVRVNLTSHWAKYPGGTPNLAYKIGCDCKPLFPLLYPEIFLSGGHDWVGWVDNDVLLGGQAFRQLLGAVRGCTAGVLPTLGEEQFQATQHPALSFGPLTIFNARAYRSHIQPALSSHVGRFVMRDAIGGTPYLAHWDEWGVEAGGEGCDPSVTSPPQKSGCQAVPIYRGSLPNPKSGFDAAWAREASFLADARRSDDDAEAQRVAQEHDADEHKPSAAPVHGPASHGALQEGEDGSAGPVPSAGSQEGEASAVTSSSTTKYVEGDASSLVELAFSREAADAAFARSMSAVLLALVKAFERNVERRQQRGEEPDDLTSLGFHLPSHNPRGCLVRDTLNLLQRAPGHVADVADMALDDGVEVEWTTTGWARHGTGYRFPGSQLDDMADPPAGFRCRLDGRGEVGVLTGSHGLRSSVPGMMPALLCHYHERKHKLANTTLAEIAARIRNGSMGELLL